MLSRLFRKPAAWTALALLMVASGGCQSGGDDGEASPDPPPTSEAPATVRPEPAAENTPEPGEPEVVAEGEFINHEVTTTGTAQVILDPDGSLRLELVGFETSGGPALKIWLTDQPVIEGEAGWHVFDDGEWEDLGPLQATEGDQTYEIPADVDPADYTSVSVWCQQYAVSFGAAALSTG